MNPFRLARNLLSLAPAGFTATAATLTWNNASGGAWNQATNWNPIQVPGALDSVVIDLPGTYTIDFSGTVTVASLAIGGTASNPTLLVGGGVFGVSGAASLRSGATLNLIGGGLRGSWIIDEGARLELSSNPQKGLYDFNLLNRGTLRWLGGSVMYDSAGAHSTITNRGLWEIHSDSSWLYAYSGARPSLRNEGIIRKVGGTGNSTLNNLNFSNGGEIDVDQGQLILQSIEGVLTGTANVSQGAALVFRSATITNSGPVSFMGPGRSTFESGTLWLGGSIQPNGLQLTGGTLRLLPTFQGGVISNLFLHGITLAGTNRVQGLLTTSNSPIADLLIVEPGGQFDLMGSSFSPNAEWHLLNLGTVRWISGSLSFKSDQLPERLYRAIGP